MCPVACSLFPLPDFSTRSAASRSISKRFVFIWPDAEQRGIYFPLTASSADAFDQLSQYFTVDLGRRLLGSLGCLQRLL